MILSLLDLPEYAVRTTRNTSPTPLDTEPSVTLRVNRQETRPHTSKIWLNKDKQFRYKTSHRLQLAIKLQLLIQFQLSIKLKMVIKLRSVIRSQLVIKLQPSIRLQLRINKLRLSINLQLLRKIKDSTENGTCSDPATQTPGGGDGGHSSVPSS